MIILASFHPWYSLKKGQVNFGASKKSSAGFPASAAATTRSKLSCGNLASIGSNPSRARRAWEYGRKVPEFLNPTKEHGFIQPQSGGKDAFDSEPACLSWLPPVVFVLVKESSDLTLILRCLGAAVIMQWNDLPEGCQFIAIFLRCPLWSGGRWPCSDLTRQNALVLFWTRQRDELNCKGAINTGE
jgi:hypothetical protein